MRLFGEQGRFCAVIAEDQMDERMIAEFDQLGGG